MAKLQQSQPIAPPLISDKDLQQYTTVIQANLFELWNNAHNHIPSSAQKAQWNALTTDVARIQFLAALLGF